MRKYKHVFLLMVGVGATVVLGEPSSDIPFPLKRRDTVKFAQTLVSGQPGLSQPIGEGSYKNPFNPGVEALEPSPSHVVGVQSTSAPGEIVQLAEIAPKITPSGAVIIGGESFLMFGQKRFKVSDHLPIVFEGKSYDLEIVQIQSTSFTLRLNGVEITRPIKSVIKPAPKP